MNNKKEDGEPVLAAIKEALKHPMALPREEAIELILRPPYMGKPEPLLTPNGKRGPKTKRTQYQLALELRKDVYRRLVKLPTQRKGKTGGGYVPLLVDKILEIARNVLVSRKRVAAVRRELAISKLSCPHDSTIRKILRKHGLK